MASTKRKGNCKLCGTFGELTFEHLPPESAFNDKRILLHSLRYIQDESYRIARKTPKRRLPRGLGDYTLCGRCNSRTGSWYGSDYATWAQQAMSYLDAVHTSQVIYVAFRIRPLNVLKQIVSMGLSGSTSGSMTHPDLARFVLNRKSRSFPHGYGCYSYLTNKKSEARYCTEMAMMNVETGTMDHVLREVALPPLGCVLLKEARRRPFEISGDNLCLVNFFANYDFDQLATVYLKIPAHRIWSPTPLDYRKVGYAFTNQFMNTDMERRF